MEPVAVMNMSEENVSRDCADWIIPDFGDIHNSTIKKSLGTGLPTAEDIENIYLQARKEGFAEGYAAGTEAARADIDSRINTMTGFVKILQEPYKQISDDVIDTIKHIAIIIAGQIIRREITSDENNIIAAIKKSLLLVDEIDRPMTIHLNPNDLSTAMEYLSSVEGNVKFIEDVTISRGGCKIDTAMSIIDATIESQITEIAATLIGGSRFDDG